MILELFLAILGLSLFGVWAGYMTGDKHHAFIGFFFLFILGTIIFTGGLEYKTGTNSTICSYQDTFVYGDNYTGVYWVGSSSPVCSATNPVDCVNVFHQYRNYSAGCTETTMNVYETYNDTWSWWVGFLLALAGGFGMSLMMFNWRSKK